MWGGGKGEGGRELLFPALPFQRWGWEGAPGGGGDRREKRSPWGEIANGDDDGEGRTATIEVGSPTDLPFFVVFLHICKIVVPIGFGFFCYL